MTGNTQLTYQSRPVFKVLGANGESIHGGSLTWSLPVVDGDTVTPGQWHEVVGEIACCSNGLHLTTAPARWWQSDARLFVVEYEGDTDTEGGADDDKIAVRRARLVREELDWNAHGVFTTGSHSVSSGFSRASGSATVRASDSATVEAFDSATVRAFDSATVRASGSATVRAFDSATVRAFDSATVVRTPYHRGGWLVLKDFAGVIDRRAQRNGGVPVAHLAPWSDAPSFVEARD